METDCITIYTDGAAQGNPGRGGYAAILIYKDTYKELSGGFRRTTNNRMELLAVIKALECLKKESKVVVYSDSKYVIHTIEKKWIHKWLQNDFKQKKNADLWKRFWSLYQLHDVEMYWLKGHAGYKENERCDVLAKKSIDNVSKLAIDEVYETIERGY